MALSPLEDRYLTALTAVQFPDTPVEPETPAEQPTMLAAGPSSTATDAPASIGPIPRNKAQEALGFVGELLTKAGVQLDKVGVDVPVLGRITLKDLTVGDAGRVLEDMSYGFMPVRGAGGIGGTTGLKPDALELLNVAPSAAVAKPAARALVKATEGLPVGLSIKDVSGMPNVVSTRLPTAKKATEDPLANRLIIDLQSAKADPKAFETNMGLVQQYPNFASKARNPDRRAEDFIEHVKDNLLYLYDQVPEQTRQRSKLWYDGARNIVDRWGNEYGVQDQALSGVLAVLSPQKDWFMNVSLGNRVIDIALNQSSRTWDSAMENTAARIWADPKYEPVLDLVRGKSFAQLESPAEKALWLRTFDQTFNPREHQIVTPEGDFAGIRLTQAGKPYATGWGSLNEIGKAVSILENPSLENISAMLGGQHKVRNFYNNIYAPADPAGHVTIDTHAVAAGLLRPLSGASREVMHNFGKGVVGERGAANSSITGAQGTYGLYAEAYRRAAADRGVLPREMQSITWEAVRGLFPDTFKTDKNAQLIDGIWVKYRKGQLSLEEARNEVFRAAGGIDAPEWERAGLRGAAPGEGGAAADAGQLSRPGVPRRDAAGSGRNEPTAGNPPGVTGSQPVPAMGAE